MEIKGMFTSFCRRGSGKADFDCDFLLGARLSSIPKTTRLWMNCQTQNFSWSRVHFSTFTYKPTRDFHIKQDKNYFDPHVK